MRLWLVNGESVHEDEVWSSFGQIGLDIAGCRMWLRERGHFRSEPARVSSALDCISIQRDTDAGPLASCRGRGCDPTIARNPDPRISLDAQAARAEWTHVVV